MILVTGAGGQVGRECVERGGSGILPLAALPPSMAVGGREVLGLDRAALDLRDTKAITAALDRIKPRAVINGAAYTAVDKAEADSATAFAVNHEAVATLAAACATRHIPLLHVSTDYVFDGAKPAPYVEDDAVNPLGVYGLSKLKGEQALRAAHPRHLILRTSWVFGRYGANFVKTMLRLARERPELRVVSDQQGAPTEAGALAEALLALARRAANGESLPWGTYHCCGAPHTTWHGFAQTIIARGAALGLIAKPVPVQAIATRDFPTPAKRPMNSRLDCTRLREKLGIEPTPWMTGLDFVLRHLKETAA